MEMGRSIGLGTCLDRRNSLRCLRYAHCSSDSSWQEKQTQELVVMLVLWIDQSKGLSPNPQAGSLGLVHLFVDPGLMLNRMDCKRLH